MCVAAPSHPGKSTVCVACAVPSNEALTALSRAHAAVWLGSFVAGLPAIFAAGVPLLVRALRLVSSGLGLAGIFFIMLSATKRLEAKQDEKYRYVGGIRTKYYDEYYAGSNALIPKLF